MKGLTILSAVIRQDEAGRYSLNDLHRAAGGQKRHGPSYWLASKQTRDLIAAMETAGSPVVTMAGRNGGTFVAKELVYAYAMWISPSFCLKVIRAYDQMHTSSMSAWQQLQVLVAEEVSTQVRASFGSRLMLERKRAIPEFQRRREALEAEVQPPLQLH